MNSEYITIAGTALGAIGGAGGIGVLLTRAFTGAQKQWLVIHQAQGDDLKGLRLDLAAARNETLDVRKLAIEALATERIESAQALAQLRLELTREIASVKLISAQEQAECRRQIDELLFSMHTMQLENAGLRQILTPAPTTKEAS